MALSDALTAKLNEQVTNEFGASHIYLSMACMFERMSLKMLAQWFYSQANEERGHAMKLLKYVLDRGGKAQLAAIPAPPIEFPTVVDAIAAAHKHEQKVTGQINALVELAQKENDHATESFLGWFVDEQVEEESSISHLHEIARMATHNLLQLEAYVAHLGRSE